MKKSAWDWLENLLEILAEQERTLSMAQKWIVDNGSSFSLSWLDGNDIVDRSTAVVRYTPKWPALVERTAAAISSHISWHDLSLDHTLNLDNGRLTVLLSRINPLTDKRRPIVEHDFGSNTFIIWIDATTVTVMEKGIVKKYDLKTFALMQRQPMNAKWNQFDTIIAKMEALKWGLKSTANSLPQQIPIIKKPGNNNGNRGYDSLT